MFVFYVHNDNCGAVSLEGRLNERADNVADLTPFLLDVATFGASASSYFHEKRVCNTGLCCKLDHLKTI